jgi:two-component system nitrogen regulation response regulator GlnG
VLTDLHMPGINGIQLVRSIQESYPDIHVVFISGQPQESGLADFPGAAFLRKPFTLTDLLRVVRGALGTEPSKA